MDKEFKPSDFDDLECPHCDKICRPVKVKPNGTVVYKNHECSGQGYSNYSFEIDVNGDLIE